MIKEAGTTMYCYQILLPNYATIKKKLFNKTIPGGYIKLTLTAQPKKMQQQFKKIRVRNKSNKEESSRINTQIMIV